MFIKRFNELFKVRKGIKRKLSSEVKFYSKDSSELRYSSQTTKPILKKADSLSFKEHSYVNKSPLQMECKIETIKGKIYNKTLFDIVYLTPEPQTILKESKKKSLTNHKNKNEDYFITYNPVSNSYMPVVGVEPPNIISVHDAKEMQSNFVDTFNKDQIGKRFYGKDIITKKINPKTNKFSIVDQQPSANMNSKEETKCEKITENDSDTLLTRKMIKATFSKVKSHDLSYLARISAMLILCDTICVCVLFLWSFISKIKSSYNNIWNSWDLYRLTYLLDEVTYNLELHELLNTGFASKEFSIIENISNTDDFENKLQLSIESARNIITMISNYKNNIEILNSNITFMYRVANTQVKNETFSLRSALHFLLSQSYLINVKEVNITNDSVFYLLYNIENVLLTHISNTTQAYSGSNINSIDTYNFMTSMIVVTAALYFCFLVCIVILNVKKMQILYRFLSISENRIVEMIKNCKRFLKEYLRIFEDFGKEEATLEKEPSQNEKRRKSTITKCQFDSTVLHKMAIVLIALSIAVAFIISYSVFTQYILEWLKQLNSITQINGGIIFNVLFSYSTIRQSFFKFPMIYDKPSNLNELKSSLSFLKAYLIDSSPQMKNAEYPSHMNFIREFTQFLEIPICNSTGFSQLSNYYSCDNFSDGIGIQGLNSLFTYFYENSVIIYNEIDTSFWDVTNNTELILLHTPIIINFRSLIKSIIPYDYIHFIELYRNDTEAYINAYSLNIQFVLVLYLILFIIFEIFVEVMVSNINLEISKMRWMITFLSPTTVKSSDELRRYVLSEIKGN